MFLPLGKIILIVYLYFHVCFLTRYLCITEKQFITFLSSLKKIFISVKLKSILAKITVINLIKVSV